MPTEQNTPNYSPEIYTKIALNDLVTYGVFFLSQSKPEITAEDIVAVCFLLFPKRFALNGYSQWPDSTVVNKRWIDCRDKGLIVGSTARGFSLTPKGLEVADRIARILDGRRPLMAKPGQDRVRANMRTRAGRFVRSLEESDAFKHYRQMAEEAVISEFDFRSMLLCTMESSANTLRSNLDQFRQYASLCNREDIVGFLDFCRRKFAHVLTDATDRGEQYRGGMLYPPAKSICASHSYLFC